MTTSGYIVIDRHSGEAWKVSAMPGYAHTQTLRRDGALTLGRDMKRATLRYLQKEGLVRKLP